MLKSPEQFNTYSEEQALEEAEKMQEKISRGVAKDYNEAGMQIEQEEVLLEQFKFDTKQQGKDKGFEDDDSLNKEENQNDLTVHENTKISTNYAKDPNQHLRKIFLSDEERKLPLKNLIEKYGISKDQAYRARKIGSFCVNAHIPKEGSNVSKSTTRKNIRPLTDEERKMSISKLAKKLNIAESSASRTKQRGYVVKKGKYSNALPEGMLPEGIIEKDIISDCGTAYSRLKKRYPSVSEHREDLINEGVMRLLELTAEDKFIHPHWRQKVAYYSMLNYAIKNIFQPYNKEKYLINNDKNKILMRHYELDNNDDQYED